MTPRRRLVDSDRYRGSSASPTATLHVLNKDHKIITEICGGTAAVSAELLDQGYRNIGTNCDIAVDPEMDLTTRVGRRKLWHILQNEDPKFVIAAPPCTYFAGFSKINAMHDPKLYQEKRAKAETIANAVVKACEDQHRKSKYFLIENPQRSDLWRLPSTQRLLRQEGVTTLTIDQCMYGLVDKQTGERIKKTTTFLTNIPNASRWLSTRCSGDHDHQRLEGGKRVSSSQVWPLPLAQAIANIIKENTSNKVRFADTFPARYDMCAGCRGHKSSLDPSHTRVPGECRWSDLEEAAARSRAFVPRTSIGRSAPGPQGPRREPAHKGEPRQAAINTTESAEGSLARPGSADEAQEVSIQETEENRYRGEPSESSNSRGDPEDTRYRGELDNTDPDADPEARGSGSSTPSRPRKILRDAETQATDSIDQPDASAYDLSRVGRTLRDARTSDTTMKSILRRLHHRWWHASAERMRETLAATGQPERVLKAVDEVVGSCKICRAWRPPQPRSQSTTHLATRFNQRVQTDILFLDGQPTLHIIDEATRYSQARFLTNMNEETVMDALSELWVRTFGPMETLVSDQEAGLKGDYCATTLSRWGTQRLLLPEGRHAAIVERHHAVLRSTYHKIRDQASEDGIKVTADVMLAEAVFAHNVLTSVKGFSPHEAVLGRTPPIFKLDADTHEEQDDGTTDLDRTQRVREYAVTSMVRALAEDRVRRALKSRTREAAAEINYKAGDLVDFYRTPTGKVLPGWKGPAQVVDVTSLESDGIAHVKWQGRVLSVRAGDLRPHLVLPVWLLRETTVYGALFQYLDTLEATTQIFGIIKIGDKEVYTHHAQRLPHIFEMMHTLSKSELGIRSGCFLCGSGIRRVRVNQTVRGDSTKGMMLAWPKARPENILSLELSVEKEINMKEFLGQNWAHFSWIIVIEDGRNIIFDEKQEVEPRHLPTILEEDDDQDDQGVPLSRSNGISGQARPLHVPYPPTIQQQQTIPQQQPIPQQQTIPQQQPIPQQQTIQHNNNNNTTTTTTTTATFGCSARCGDEISSSIIKEQKSIKRLR